MPQLGHGLVALGIATATQHGCRRSLRYAWLGAALLLAYWPDLCEWSARLVNLRLPHSAPASVFCAAGTCVVVTAVLRFGLRERSVLVTTGVCAAVLSHTFLDMINGGIPFWWPISPRVVGTNWIDFDHMELARRTFEEFRLFTPVLALGVVTGIFAARPQPPVAGGGVVLGIVAVAAAALEWGAVLGAACALLLFARIAMVREFDWRYALNLAPALPIVLMGTAQVHAWGHMQLALRYHNRGEYSAALVHYRESGRFKPVDLESLSLVRSAWCHHRLGQDQLAFDVYQRGLREYPGHPSFALGLAELHASAADPRWRDTDRAVELCDLVTSMTREPHYLDAARRVRQTALSSRR